MDTMQAYLRAQAAKGNEPKVFDWEKAAKLITERKATSASAGLSGDWEWTGGEILRDGKPVPKDKTYTYLASVWATPELEIDGETIDCYRMQSETPGWDGGTYWPPEALALMGANAEVSGAGTASAGLPG